MFYYVVFAVVVPMMVRIPARLSASEPNHGILIKCTARADDVAAGHHNYWTYAGRLSDGWLLGWKVVSPGLAHKS